MPLQNIFSKPRMLAAIEWNETSGVDHPANKVEGWLVMKSADSDIEAIIAEEEEFAKAGMSLLQMLETATKRGYFDGADAAVRKSVETVQTWLQEEGFGDDAPAEAKGLRERLMAYIGRFRKGDNDEQAEFDAFREAITDAWPSFASKAASIINSSDAVDVKVAAIQKAVADLGEQVMSKHGKYKHDNSVHVAAAADDATENRCPDCGMANKMGADTCDKCGAKLKAAA